MAATTSVQEHHLVREVLHCCQGIDGGRYVWYQEDLDGCGGFSCGPGVDVSPAHRQLISRITELGWLLKKVKDLTNKIAGTNSVVHEALAAACNKEINNCYRLIAILEAQSQQQLQQPNTNEPSSGQLSLRRLIVWVSEPLQRLRTIASCLEATISLRGGQVINALHAMSKHGDPLVRRTIAPLLEETCVPYFKLIARWVLDGTLDSTENNDFMIQYIASDNPDANTIWHSGFTLNKSMQPRFMTDQLSEQVLSAGKTVAFLREVCKDSQWAALMSGTSATALDAQGGTYQRLVWLQAAIGDVNKTVGVRLLDIIISRERLVDHLHSIKRFLLFSQGDFLRSLVDLAGADLDRPARELSSYSMQGYVDAAMRSCGASIETMDIQKRVQVKLQRPLEGDIGWDVFGVSYAIDGPCVAVLSATSMALYGRISRFLWIMKHVDHVVALSWHSLNNISHTLAALRALKRQHGIDDVAEGVPSLLRYVHTRRADMEQFVIALQSHIVFEVVEPAWAVLLDQVGKAEDMEAVITAHEKALMEIAKGTFLNNSNSSGSSNNNSNNSNSGGRSGAHENMNTSNLTASNASDVHAALRAALRSVLDVQGPVRRLSNAVENALHEQQRYLKKVKESEAGGEWNEEVYNSPAGIDEELLAEIRSATWRVHSAFDRHLRTFLSLLPPHSHLDLRSLSSRLESLEAH